MPIPSPDRYSQKAIDTACDIVKDFGLCTECDKNPSLCCASQTAIEYIIKAYEPDLAQRLAKSTPQNQKPDITLEESTRNAMAVPNFMKNLPRLP